MPKAFFYSIANNYSNFRYTGGIIRSFWSRDLSGVLKDRHKIDIQRRKPLPHSPSPIEWSLLHGTALWDHVRNDLTGWTCRWNTLPFISQRIFLQRTGCKTGLTMLKVPSSNVKNLTRFQISNQIHPHFHMQIPQQKASIIYNYNKLSELTPLHQFGMLPACLKGWSRILPLK